MTRDSQTSSSQPSHPLVIVADDSAPMVETVRAVLEPSGLTVIGVQDGLELEEVVREQAAAGAMPAAVVSDVYMPGQTGTAAAASLLSDFPELPVILCSAFSSDELRDQAADLGVRALLDKPVALRELRDTVLAALES